MFSCWEASTAEMHDGSSSWSCDISQQGKDSTQCCSAEHIGSGLELEADLVRLAATEGCRLEPPQRFDSQALTEG